VTENSLILIFFFKFGFKESELMVLWVEIIYNYRTNDSLKIQITVQHEEEMSWYRLYQRAGPPNSNKNDPSFGTLESSEHLELCSVCDPPKNIFHIQV
jgi:hypothetical protein